MKKGIEVHTISNSFEWTNLKEENQRTKTTITINKRVKWLLKFKIPSIKIVTCHERGASASKVFNERKHHKDGNDKIINKKAKYNDILFKLNLNIKK